MLLGYEAGTSLMKYQFKTIFQRAVVGKQLTSCINDIFLGFVSHNSGGRGFLGSDDVFSLLYVQVHGL